MFYYSDPDLFTPVTNPARVLARAGYQVDLIAYYRDRNRWAIDYGPGVRLIRLNQPGGVAPAHPVQKIRGLTEFLVQAHRIAKRERYDLLYGHDMHGFLAAHPAARLLKQPLVYHCHELPQLEELGALDRWVKRYERRHAQEADVTVLPESRRAQTFVQQNRPRKDPLIVWNCPLKGPRPQAKSLAVSLGISPKEGARFVVRQGRLGPGQGIEETVRSMHSWPPEVRLVLLGYLAAAYAQRLRELGDLLGLGNRIHFLAAVPPDHIFDRLAGADLGHCLYRPVTLNYRFASTASLKFFDYMRAGLPILAPEEEGFRALIRQFDCGICVDANDPDAIGTGVGRVFRDEAARRQWSGNAYQAYEKRCHYELQYEPVLDLLKQLL